jgi:hypothetical protein
MLSQNSDYDPIQEHQPNAQAAMVHYIVAWSNWKYHKAERIGCAHWCVIKARPIVGDIGLYASPVVST